MATCSSPSRTPRRTLVTGGSGFIGTHLVAALLATGRDVLNASRRPPRDAAQRGAFTPVDVRDAAAVSHLVRSFRPTEIVHLAAETCFVGRADPEGYEINTTGTAHVVAAAAATNAPIRCIQASSNVVAPPNSPARAMLGDYTASKREAERIVYSADPGAADWCIVRPCFVWGPWFEAPFREFFLAVARRRYRHLGREHPPKRFGYVGNVVAQILGLLDAPRQAVRGGTFYLSDYDPMTIAAWADLIARELGAPPPGTLPEPAVRLLAWAGDAARAVGLSPPLTSRRLRNMRSATAHIPIDATRQLVPELPYTVEQGVRHTLDWMQGQGLIPAPHPSGLEVQHG